MPVRTGRLDDAGAVDAALAELDALAVAATEADAAARAARRTRDEAAAVSTPSSASSRRRPARCAPRAIRSCRWACPALRTIPWPGGPRSSTGPHRRWPNGTRRSPTPSARRPRPPRLADEAERAAEVAVAELAARRREAAATARTEQQAQSRVDTLDERVAALRAALAGAPSAEQVDADLARLDVLEASARDADAALRAARAARTAAEEAAEAVGREVTAGWEALRAARDPLVALGAPAVAGDDLAAAWSALVTWAAEEAADRAAREPAAVEPRRPPAQAAQQEVHARLAPRWRPKG